MDPILRVVDPTSLQVAVTVTVQDLDKIQVGQPATIVSVNGQEPGTVAVRPLPQDPRAATQEIRVSFSNPTSTLPVDSPVQVEIILAERQNCTRRSPWSRRQGSRWHCVRDGRWR